MSLKPTLCLDFDGVIHSYASGWVQPDFIPDAPVPGAFQFLLDALDSFEVVIFSSRSHQSGGIRAMQIWLEYWAKRELANDEASKYAANTVINRIAWNKDAWPTTKPAAFVSIDDRAVQFTGKWPPLGELRAFKPWNKR